MNQFPYLYPHSLSEVERLNEEELWQDNRDAEVSHTQLTEIFRHSDPAALMDEAEQAQLAELDDTVTVYRGVTTINSDNLLALSWTLDYTIIDTTDYLADQLFVKNEVRVWFGQEYICPDGPYCVIFCKCRKRDTGAFESAMNELPRKMLLRGHTDYIQFCEGLKNKIAAAWKSGGELQHEEARPSA